jgi:hypothetical protein
MPVPRVGLAQPQRGHQAAVQGLPDGLRRPGHGGALPPLAGLVNLTVPLTTVLGLTQARAGRRARASRRRYRRVLACTAAGHRATRWQITVTAPDGTALAHSTAPPPASSGQAATRQAAPGQAAGGPANATNTSLQHSLHRSELALRTLTGDARCSWDGQTSAPWRLRFRAVRDTRHGGPYPARG